MNQANYWITKLQLKPHPEGGYYKETYQSDFYLSADSLKESHVAERRSSTLIYFLLKDEDYSQFHRLKSDEIWIYQYGESMTIHVITPDGKLLSKKLGKNIEDGENMQLIVPANSWFSAELNNINSFSLVSCMVSPGFVFDDFELAKQDELIIEYPQYVNLIKRLTQ